MLCCVEKKKKKNRLELSYETPKVRVILNDLEEIKHFNNVSGPFVL